METSALCARTPSTVRRGLCATVALWAPCEEEACPHALGPNKADVFEHIQHYLREIILSHHPSPDAAAAEQLVLEVFFKLSGVLPRCCRL